MYRIIRNDPSNAVQVLLLETAVEAMKDTIAENGLVPTRLVFEVIQQFPVIWTKALNQKESMKVLAAPEALIIAIIVE